MDFMKLHKYNPKKDYSRWYLQEKVDGVFAAIDVNTGIAYSRTGKPLFIPEGTTLRCTMDYIRMYYSVNKQPANTFIIAEIFSFGLTLEQMSGLLNPNRKEPWDKTILTDWSVYAHDFVTLVDGVDNTPYSERYNKIIRMPQNCVDLRRVYNIVLENAKEAAAAKIEEEFNSLMLLNCEGIVLKDPNGIYRMGKRVNTQVKRVREHLEDVRIEQVKYGTGKRNGQIGSMYCRSIDNPEIAFWADFGLNWDDSKRIELTSKFELDNKSLIGTIWTVKGLQQSSTGKSIRLPKLMYMRFDKE